MALCDINMARLVTQHVHTVQSTANTVSEPSVEPISIYIGQLSTIIETQLQTSGLVHGQVGGLASNHHIDTSVAV